MSYQRRSSDVHRRRSHYGSGLTHARYSHEVGVTRIAVVCPVCGRCADARNGAADPHALVISHLAAAWQAAAWQARCQSCMWRAKDLTRAAVMQRPLYFASPYHDFWAWNREHLQWLLRVLQRADANTDAYARLRTYVPGHWLAARRRYARIVQRMLES